MPTLQYTVFEGASITAKGDPIQEGVVSIGGTAANSSAITSAGINSPRTRRVVRMMADTACWVTWGASPTALNDGTEGRMLGAENPEYFEIESSHVISVIERV